LKTSISKVYFRRRKKEKNVSKFSFINFNKYKKITQYSLTSTTATLDEFFKQKIYLIIFIMRRNDYKIK